VSFVGAGAFGSSPGIPFKFYTKKTLKKQTEKLDKLRRWGKLTVPQLIAELGVNNSISPGYDKFVRFFLAQQSAIVPNQKVLDIVSPYVLQFGLQVVFKSSAESITSAADADVDEVVRVFSALAVLPSDDYRKLFLLFAPIYDRMAELIAADFEPTKRSPLFARMVDLSVKQLQASQPSAVELPCVRFLLESFIAWAQMFHDAHLAPDRIQECTRILTSLDVCHFDEIGVPADVKDRFLAVVFRLFETVHTTPHPVEAVCSLGVAFLQALSVGAITHDLSEFDGCEQLADFVVWALDRIPMLSTSTLGWFDPCEPDDLEIPEGDVPQNVILPQGTFDGVSDFPDKF
jgi:hypothetical protein